MASITEIVWNGNHGRTIGGRTFRKSDDGSVYEFVGGEYVPYSSKDDSHVDLNAISWQGENGRTVNGRRFRKSGQNIYERVKNEWIPFYKPDVALAKEATTPNEKSAPAPKEAPKTDYTPSIVPAASAQSDAMPLNSDNVFARIAEDTQRMREKTK